jgi:hypothetical protein
MSCVQKLHQNKSLHTKFILVISQFITGDMFGIQKIRDNVNWVEKSRIKTRIMQHRKEKLAYNAWKSYRFRRLEMIILKGIAKL